MNTQATTATVVPMMTVQKEALNRAVALLKAAQCKYAILTPEGETLGELKIQVEPTPAPRRTRTVKYPNGELKAYYLPLIESMQHGETRVVEPGAFTAEELRSAIAGYCSHTWGNKTYITHIAAKGIELLRL